jgi:FtsH-binding integral membrane protein
MANVRSLELDRSQLALRSFVCGVYGWMCFGLGLTAAVAMLVANSPQVAQIIFANRGLFFGLIIAELLLVMGMSWAINRISSTVAIGMFLVYAAINGLTLSVVFLAYTRASIASTFFVTAGTFGAMSLYGYTTRRDLTSLGNLCFMALIGLILASVVNMFMGSEMLYWVTTYLGIGVFVGLTAYDTQKIKMMGRSMEAGSEVARKAAVLGALALYLDFINLFLLLLRLFGRRR